MLSQEGCMFLFYLFWLSLKEEQNQSPPGATKVHIHCRGFLSHTETGPQMRSFTTKTSKSSPSLLCSVNPLG